MYDNLPINNNLAGPFSGIAHAVSVLDRSKNVTLRLSVLAFLKALIMPSSGDKDPKAAINAKENGAPFIESGGVQLLADIIAGNQLAILML